MCKVSPLIKLPIPAAVEAHLVVLARVTWIQEPQYTIRFCTFAENLTAELSTCFPSPGAVHSQPHTRERMWHVSQATCLKKKGLNLPR